MNGSPPTFEKNPKLEQDELAQPSVYPADIICYFPNLLGRHYHMTVTLLFIDITAYHDS